jgi:hypothetical protein
MQQLFQTSDYTLKISQLLTIIAVQSGNRQNQAVNFKLLSQKQN